LLTNDNDDVDAGRYQFMSRLGQEAGSALREALLEDDMPTLLEAFRRQPGPETDQRRWVRSEHG